jgi:hypothetical protein
MISIPKPTIKAKEVFIECISTVDNSQLKQDYTDCQDIIENAEEEFDEKFPLYEIHQIPQNLTILGGIGKEEMKKVYTYRMVKIGMPGNKYYNILKSLAPHGKCPLCSVRGVDTLDHYLPKSKYPIFAVTPVNLVPACTPCNIGKRISFPTNEAEQTFHPYYDNVQSESWIKAKVIQTNPISFDYFVDCPNTWVQIQKNRAKNHFDAFNLNELFSSHANEELRGVKLHLQKLFNLHPGLLVEHLTDSYSSRLELGINSWQSIMYFSLLNDNWFIQGGVLSF